MFTVNKIDRSIVGRDGRLTSDSYAVVDGKGTELFEGSLEDAEEVRDYVDKKIGLYALEMDIF